MKTTTQLESYVINEMIAYCHTNSISWDKASDNHFVIKIVDSDGGGYFYRSVDSVECIKEALK